MFSLPKPTELLATLAKDVYTRFGRLVLIAIVGGVVALGSVVVNNALCDFLYSPAVPYADGTALYRYDGPTEGECFITENYFPADNTYLMRRVGDLPWNKFVSSPHSFRLLKSEDNCITLNWPYTENVQKYVANLPNVIGQLVVLFLDKEDR